jgi:hypothetical protein
MTELMKRAWDAASKLEEADQDAIAALVLEEIASEAEWDRQFTASKDRLSALADEAVQEFRQGETKSLD